MRYQSLDALRGLSIIGMILFHMNYMLVEIFVIDVFHFSHLFWYILGRVVVIVFISISGVSLYFSLQHRTLYQIATRTRERFMILTTIALTISLFTYIFFYDQRISFGIIHFFAIGTLLALPFVRLGGDILMLSSLDPTLYSDHLHISGDDTHSSSMYYMYRSSMV